ncbi:hypothetical protein AVEN_218593-1 [Araneus ventricosus]|uniref:DDE-1 domain-containing protein n=1 Tax=Araneus ventricosus TaxID=182803 RepID=A0A4Y2WCM2_ARAVE|nr:hypothetical protein AVEN_170427-1 [Araneus ventricosus]GBO34286.1 hypothetical protein AVEN_218593-1 [Araneus ventricosus]
MVASRTEFVPAVRQHTKSIILPQGALLLLDNCPDHPSSEELCTDDDEISAMFLPQHDCADPTHDPECYSKHQAGISQVAS